MKKAKKLNGNTILLLITNAGLICIACGLTVVMLTGGNAQSASMMGLNVKWAKMRAYILSSVLCSIGGICLNNARQKQENPFRAVREFIDQKVDYIVIDPITELGWESTLRDAAQAGIPVIIVDRSVAVEEDGLYVSWIGENFELEGEKACAWLKEYLDLMGMDSVNIAHIRGTEGSSAQMGRTRALETAAAQYGWNILASVDGDFVQAKGRRSWKRSSRSTAGRSRWFTAKMTTRPTARCRRSARRG